jgi:hypothetical protein
MSVAARSISLFVESVFVGFAFAIGWVLAIVALSSVMA